MIHKTFEEYPFVIGIDYGGINSGVSISHKNDAFRILTINDWTDEDKFCCQVPTSILYKEGQIYDEDSILWGAEISEATINDEDIYVRHIKQYMFNSVRKEDEWNQVGLTIQKIVTDYLSKLRVALLKLQDKNSFKSDYYRNFKLDDSRYCLACSHTQQVFMRQCFIDAGFINEDESENRLIFVTEAEAAAYNCLAWDRKSSRITVNENYLVCDIGHAAFGIARIDAKSTESQSIVELVYEDSQYGSMDLENRFRTYLELNAESLNMDQGKIDEAVREFEENLKFSFNMSDDWEKENLVYQSVDRESSEDQQTEYADQPISIFKTTEVDNKTLINILPIDLAQEVFDPYINAIIERIKDADNDDCAKIFLTGRYGSDSYFLKKLAEFSGNRLIIIDHMSVDGVSRGAVSFGMRMKKTQIPFFYNESNVIEVIKETQFINSCDFIVGIDFGTTHSGCSYARPNDTVIQSIKTRWPMQQKDTFPKAPTLIVYNSKTKKMTKDKWGQAAKNHKLVKNEHLFGNFKLFLSPESVTKFYGEGNTDIADIKEKFTLNDATAVDVIGEYLKVFKKHVDDYIIKKEAEKKFFFLQSSLKLCYVITVPAMWDKTAKDTMVRAAIKGGLVEKGQHDNLLIITEPEAAALACEEHYKDIEKKDGTTFIVCDAGGGTVDLVTFRLDINKDGTEVIHQLGEGEGDTCGSAYLDQNFREYIFNFYKEIDFPVEIETLKLDKAMRTFIEELKPKFMPNENCDAYCRIPLPEKPCLPHNVNTNRLIRRGRITELKMSNADMKTFVFDPIIKRIENLIDRQVKNLDGKIDVILLVGGFSKCKYLEERLRQRYIDTIRIAIPPNAVTAISQGAVSYAQRPRMISNKVVGLSYAIEVQTLFSKDFEENYKGKTVIANDGNEYFKSRLEYFVRKNDEVKNEDKTAIYEKTVYIEYPLNAIIAIFSCDYDKIDTIKWRGVNSEHTKVIELGFDMPYLPNKTNKDKIPFKISLQLNQIGGINISVECQTDGGRPITLKNSTSGEDNFKYVRKSDPIVMKSKLPNGAFVLPNKR